MRFKLPSDRAELGKAVDRLLRFVKRSKCVEPGAMTDLNIVLREVIANAVIHGNGARAEKEVFVRAYAAPKSGLLLIVRDEGPGFEPDSVPDPRHPGRRQLHHGRGLFLMREMMDQVEHRRGGREILLYRAHR